jgi:hypothetical protein
VIDEDTASGGHATLSRRARTVCAAVLVSLAGCSMLGPPPMEPLTAATLAAARARWHAHGADAYRLTVRVRPPRTDPAVYEVVVEHGALVAVSRDGLALSSDEARREDYSVAALFDLMQTDLQWTAIEGGGDTPAVDLRARFESDGRLVRYRRTVGTGRRRVLMIEVLAYEPAAARLVSAD